MVESVSDSNFFDNPTYCVSLKLNNVGLTDYQLASLRRAIKTCGGACVYVIVAGL